MQKSNSSEREETNDPQPTRQHWLPNLRTGMHVSLQNTKDQHYTGTVETVSVDGLTIWIRTELNERKLFHFQDGYSIHTPDPPRK